MGARSYRRCPPSEIEWLGENPEVAHVRDIHDILVCGENLNCILAPTPTFALKPLKIIPGNSVMESVAVV